MTSLVEKWWRSSILVLETVYVVYNFEVMVTDSFNWKGANNMILSIKSLYGHHQQVTNITLSPKSLSFQYISGDSDVTDIILVTLWWLRYWWQNQYVGYFPKYWIGHQHLKLVTNTFHLQQPSPTSLDPLQFVCTW